MGRKGESETDHLTSQLVALLGRREQDVVDGTANVENTDEAADSVLEMAGKFRAEISSERKTICEARWPGQRS